MANLFDTIKQTINRSWDDRICIGVTGLSQSGKSTFITSFINQIQKHDAKNARLREFVAATNHRIHAVKLLPLEDRALPLFDYTRAINGLSGDTPRWPDSTSDISGVLIQIELKDGRKTKKVYVEVRDYPGEWLVDLPMREQSFAQWSEFIQRQLSEEPRRSFASNPLAALSAVNPFDEYNDLAAKKLKYAYCEFLRDCKAHSPSLSLLQPGRFLQPGAYNGHQMLDFYPLLSCVGFDEKALKRAPDNSVYKVLEKRYSQYKSELIETFFDDFISPVEKQVVLVDVLNVLNGGKHYVDDMINALDMIGASFRYKSRFFSSNIKEVMYIGTKADHVLKEEHDHIRDLLSDIVSRSIENIKDHKVAFTSEAIAAIRCSQEVADVDRPINVLKAHGDDGSVIKYEPPQIPDHIPSSTREWLAFDGWRWPKLTPPKGVRVARDQAIQHIHMDYVIQKLIGDLCK